MWRHQFEKEVDDAASQRNRIFTQRTEDYSKHTASSLAVLVSTVWNKRHLHLRTCVARVTSYVSTVNSFKRYATCTAIFDPRLTLSINLCSIKIFDTIRENTSVGSIPNSDLQKFLTPPSVKWTNLSENKATNENYLQIPTYKN